MTATYLYSYGSGPHGASPTRRDRAFIVDQNQFARVHPELMDRLFELADRTIAAGGDYGFGGGWRSADQQLALFLSRYTKVPAGTPNAFYWDGLPLWPQHASWYKHTSGAPSAPPGRSYHESTTAKGTGFALAVDMVGTHNIANPLAEACGLRHFANVNREPWHHQPIEIPNARRNYVDQFESPTQWFPEAPQMKAIQPVRLIDTRPLGAVVAPNQEVQVTAAGDRPTWAKSALVNITVTDTAGPGFVTAWASGARPGTSNVNYSAKGALVSNVALVLLDASGRFVVSPAAAGCHVIVDQMGWAE